MSTKHTFDSAKAKQAASMRKTQVVSRKLAIEAKCNDCCAGYVDGKKDCLVTKCPLYYFMPYRQHTPVMKWMELNPRKVQKPQVTHEETNAKPAK